MGGAGANFDEKSEVKVQTGPLVGGGEHAGFLKLCSALVAGQETSGLGHLETQYVIDFNGFKFCSLPPSPDSPLCLPH